jgi:hypothetical protein
MHTGKSTGRLGLHPRQAVTGVLLVLTALLLAACSVMPRIEFTEKEQNIAQIPGMPNVRFFADAPLEEVAGVLGKDAIVNAAKSSGSFDVLAISGGAYDGAFGAGAINGWTASRHRPHFIVVSGVSAGSLIAPFAFLGPQYDRQLREAFTSGEAEPIGDGSDNVLSILGGADMRREALRNLIVRFVDEKFLHAVAVEHARGRRLLVVTTNLDAQRAVVWNMGAIAASGSPHALELFRDVLTASASIPGVFAPSRIEVTAGGRHFEELHVDGAVTTNVFTMPEAFLSAGMEGGMRKYLPGRMFVLMNTRLSPEFEVVEAGLGSLAGRSLSTLLKAHSKTTVLASIDFARATGIDFNLAYIHRDFQTDLKPGFNTDYMRAMYEYGHKRAVAPGFWEKTLAAPGTNVAAARR